MAWTAPATATVGQILTAAFMNAQLRDNMLLTAPAKITADGMMVIGTGTNATKGLDVMGALDVFLMEVGAWEFDLSALTTNDAVGGASAGVAEIKTPVTQAEAEAGTNTRFSLWSAERVKQAIAALAIATEATQSDMEDEGVTNPNRYVSPEVAKNAPSAAKVWVQWEQTGAHGITVSYNMTSVTDGGAVGDTDHLFNTDFSGTAFSLGGSNDGTGGFIYIGSGTKAAGGVTTICTTHDNTNFDAGDANMQVFGDQ